MTGIAKQEIATVAVGRKNGIAARLARNPAVEIFSWAVTWIFFTVLMITAQHAADANMPAGCFAYVIPRWFEALSWISIGAFGLTAVLSVVARKHLSAKLVTALGGLVLMLVAWVSPHLAVYGGCS